MQVLFIAAFIIVLGIITLIPTDIGRKVVSKTESLISHPTNTPTPTTTVQTTEPTQPATVSPTLQIKPIIRRSEGDDD